MAYETAILIGFGLLSFTFCYISINISKKHGVLQALFLFIGLLLALNTVGLAKSIANENNATSTTLDVIDTGVVTTTWTFYFVAVYFVIMFIWAVLEKFGKVSSVRW